MQNSKNLLQVGAEILKICWNYQIKAGVIEMQSIADALDFSKDLGIKLMIFIEQANVFRVCVWEKSQFYEYLLSNKTELSAYIQKMVVTNVSSSAITNNLQQMNLSNSNTKCQCQQVPNSILKCESSLPSVEYNFFVPEKLTTNKRKRLEVQIEQNMLSVFAKFNRKEKIIVIAIDASAAMLRTLVGNIDPSVEVSKQLNTKALAEVTER